MVKSSGARRRARQERQRRAAPLTIAEGWNLAPDAKLSFEDVAEAMRKSTAALATMILENVKEHEIGVPEAMTAIATGALGYSVNAYFRFFTAIGMPADKIKEQLQETIEDVWRQTIQNYVKHAIETSQGEA